MTPILRWEIVDKTKKGDPKRIELYAGSNPAHLAALIKATKWWEAIIWLDGCQPTKDYGPLEDQKADVENRVCRWFEQAMTPLPESENG
jgi:hypothetical protein